MITYLTSKGYAGARSGVQNQLQMYSPLNPFKINYNIYRPDQPFTVFTQFAEQAIVKKGWSFSWLAESASTFAIQGWKTVV